MFEYFAKKKAAAEAAAKAKLDADRAKHEKLLAQAENNMLSKICPFVNGPCQGSACVHYKKGWVYEFNDLDDYYVGHEGPKCKLWVRAYV